MGKKLLSSAVVIASLASSSAGAWTKEWHRPYLGADLQVRRMDFRGGFGDNLLQHHSPQGNVYAGFKFNRFAGLEAGFEATTTRTRTATLTTGDVAAGAPIVAAVSPIVFKSKAKIKGPHINLMGYYSFYEGSPVELIGSIGIARYKTAFERKTLQFGMDPMIPSSMTRTFSKHKNILRLMGGLQAMFTDHLGMRLIVGWANTSKMVVTSNDGRMPSPEVKPKNSVIYGLGALWVF